MAYYSEASQLQPANQFDIYNRVFIRPQSKEADGMNFVVCGIRSSVGTGCAEGDILYNLKVDYSTQKVCGKTKDGKTAFSSCGGLFNSRDMMSAKLSDCASEITISHDTMTDMGGQSEPMRWMPDLDDDRIKGAPEFRVMQTPKEKGSQVTQLALMERNQRSTVVVIWFTKGTLTAAKEMVVILGALKVFYSNYFLHLYTVPTQVPAQVLPKSTEGWPPLFLLSKLKLRLSCVDKSGNIFLDMLDESTDSTSLIAHYCYGKARRLLVTFYNAHGEKLFFAKTEEDQIAVVTVYGLQGALIGKFDPGTEQFSVGANHCPQMHLVMNARKDRSGIEYGTRNVYWLDQPEELVASCYGHLNENIATLYITPSLEEKHKMLAIGVMCTIAMGYYKLSNETMLPVSGDYIHKKQKKFYEFNSCQ